MGARRYRRSSSPPRWLRETGERAGELWEIRIHNLFEGSNELLVRSRGWDGRWYRKCRFWRRLGCLKLLVGRFSGRQFGLFRPSSSIRSISREFSSFKKITNLVFYVA